MQSATFYKCEKDDGKSVAMPGICFLHCKINWINKKLHKLFELLCTFI